MRKLVLLVVIGLILAACGGDAEPNASTTSSPQPQTTETTSPSASDTTSTTTGEEPPSETAAPADSTEASGPSFDGPAAPDFELLLADGSTFRLSDEEKPVYMVFWAEW